MWFAVAIHKYLPPERLDVLRDARIRFTQPNALNDPFELKPFFKTIFNMETFRDNVLKKMEYRPILLEKYEQMPHELRALWTRDQFVKYAIDKIESNKDYFEAMFNSSMDELIAEMPALSKKFRSILHGQLGSGVGILSLSEDPTNDLMWAHYASNHSGFVITFDETNAFFHSERSNQDEFFHLRKVSYIGKHLSFESFEEMVDDENELFISKLDAWAYEREWRMLAPLMKRVPEIDASEPIHLVPFPRAAVSGIIFGHKSSPLLRDRVMPLLSGGDSYGGVRTDVAYVDLENGRIATKLYP